MGGKPVTVTASRYHFPNYRIGSGSSYICKLLGYDDVSVIGEGTRPDDDWVKARNIHGANGRVVGISEENVRTAQICAMLALRYPYEGLRALATMSIQINI